MPFSLVESEKISISLYLTSELLNYFLQTPDWAIATYISPYLFSKLAQPCICYSKSSQQIHIRTLAEISIYILSHRESLAYLLVLTIEI